MKKYIIVSLLAISFIISPVFVDAQTSQPEQIATLVRLLQSLIQLLQQQLSILQGQNPVIQPPPIQQTNEPTITSIFPTSGPVGTVVKIRGLNLSGFEGDLIADFERSDGKVVKLYSIVPYSTVDVNGNTIGPLNTNLIKVKVEPPCQRGQTVTADYSGIQSVCDYFEFTPGTYKVYVTPWGKKSNIVYFTVTAPVARNSKCGLTVNSPAPNSSVSFPLTVTGVVDNRNAQQLGCSWQMFEGQAGNAQLYWYNKDYMTYGTRDWNPLRAVPVMVANSNWMTAGPVGVTAVVGFDNSNIGLPSGTPMKIVFTEENASGLPPVDTFELPFYLR